MASSRWQKQHEHFTTNIWVASAVIALLLFLVLILFGFRVEVAGVLFIALFLLLRIILAFIFENRYGNTMVRILKFDYEELERDFRLVFKDKTVRFYREVEEDFYAYEFPGRGLNMKVEPYWLSYDADQAATKVTLYTLNARNEPFAEMLAQAIDEMAAQRAIDADHADTAFGGAV